MGQFIVSVDLAESGKMADWFHPLAQRTLIVACYVAAVVACYVAPETRLMNAGSTHAASTSSNYVIPSVSHSCYLNPQGCHANMFACP